LIHANDAKEIVILIKIVNQVLFVFKRVERSKYRDVPMGWEVALMGVEQIGVSPRYLLVDDDGGFQ